LEGQHTNAAIEQLLRHSGKANKQAGLRSTISVLEHTWLNVGMKNNNNNKQSLFKDPKSEPFTRTREYQVTLGYPVATRLHCHERHAMLFGIRGITCQVEKARKDEC
jgi:hypothetical protein